MLQLEAEATLKHQALSFADLEFLRGLLPEYASLYVPYWNRESTDQAATLVERGVLTESGEGISRKGMWFDLTPKGRRALLSAEKRHRESEWT